jgi:hypothetical protein
MHAPTSVHWTAAKRVLRYLKGTIDSGLYYTKVPITLSGLCDSDWAGNTAPQPGLVSSFLQTSFHGPPKISILFQDPALKPNTAPCPSPLPTYWLLMLFRELQIPLPSPPTIWCDNSRALSLATNPVSHVRTKHMKVDVHFILEKVTNRNIQLRYLSTLEQVADIFTKGLTSGRSSHRFAGGC